MIASSRTGKAAALALALAAHAGILLAPMSEPAASIEGAEDGPDLALGSSFAEMVAGRVTAAGATDAAAPVAPPRAERPEATATSAPESEPIAVDRRATEPSEAAAPAPEALVRSAPAAVEALPAAEDPEEAAEPVAALRAAPPDRATVLPERAIAAPAAPAAPGTAGQPPSPDEVQAPDAAAETVAGTAPDTAAVSRSLRPRMRDPALEHAHRSAPAAQRAPDPTAAPPPRGNADTTARAGRAAGRDGGTARSTGTGSQSRAAGNAAASSYSGQVMAKLSRVRRPNVNARGTAVVAFSITAGGGLASVAIARSSGSLALDRAAVQLVRGAAPFPPPPAGARSVFRIAIDGG